MAIGHVNSRALQEPLPAERSLRFTRYTTCDASFTFKAVICNLFKLIANQFIDLGNYLDRALFVPKTLSATQVRTAAIAQKALPAPSATERRASPPEIQTEAPTPRVAQKRKKAPHTVEEKLKAYLLKWPNFSKIEFNSIETPQGIIRTEALKGIADYIDVQDLDALKDLIEKSFRKEHYEFFENHYLDKHPEIKKDIDGVKTKASWSGALVTALMAGVSYFAGNLLTPSSLEALVEELNIPGLSMVAFLALWGFSVSNLMNQFGIAKPSLTQIKEFIKQLSPSKIQEIIKESAKQFNASTCFKAGFFGVLLFFERYYGVVFNSASKLVNHVCINKLKSWFVKENDPIQLQRFDERYEMGSYEVRSIRSKLVFASLGLSLGLNWVNGTVSAAKSALSYFSNSTSTP